MAPQERPARVPADEDRRLVDGVLAGERRALAKCITLIESRRDDHRRRASAVLEALLPHAGRSLRVGISGVPGAGKSTFIEALGLHLVAAGHRLAVLAVDPSSAVSGGSILGDKTRMEKLSQHPRAFIRPSPTGGALGGVADRTREAILACEAGGHDVIVVETVGVGQSETAVAGMTDVFVLLQLPNQGDDLQAMKKGVVELADLVVYNKADLDADAARRAVSQMKGALALLRHPSARWDPPVLAASALTGKGIAEFWAEIERYRRVREEGGELAARRRHQALAWMWEQIEQGLHLSFRQHPAVKNALPDLARAVEEGMTTPALAAHRLLALFRSRNE